MLYVHLEPFSKLYRMFFLVDAFNAEPFKGNPAGVCILDDYPEDSKLQKIAKYYNWSETAFLRRLGDNEFRIRWFSPLDEAPLCGHATLASAHILFSESLVSSDFINFRYNAGEISVAKSGDDLTMFFPAKHVTKCEDFPFSVSEIINIKNYIEVVKDDLLYIIVLKTKEDVYNAVPNFDAIKKVNCRAIAITAKGDDHFDFYSRYFAPRVGIYEDPVCGSMHCRLACYWKEILNKSKFAAFQASKRSGILGVEITCDDQLVKLSSKARTICKIDFNFKDL